MARITIQDCVEKIENRFDLVVLAAQRARQVQSGSEPTVDRDNDKNSVVALREIAAASIDIENLEKTSIQAFRRHISSRDEREEELDALLDQDTTQRNKSIEIGGSDKPPTPTTSPSKANIEIGTKSASKIKTTSLTETIEGDTEENISDS